MAVAAVLEPEPEPEPVLSAELRVVLSAGMSGAPDVGGMPFDCCRSNAGPAWFRPAVSGARFSDGCASCRGGSSSQTIR